MAWREALFLTNDDGIEVPDDGSMDVEVHGPADRLLEEEDQEQLYEY